MRLPTQYTQRTPLRFNITPLIDVVFLLIIFFLVASHFARSENSDAVNLPLATLGEEDQDQAPFRLTITLDHNGAMSIAGESQSENAVLQRIEQLQKDAAAAGVNPEVRLRADKAGRYAPMRKLIEHCARQGIRSLRFAVAATSED